MARKRKVQITQDSFDQKIKVWSLVIPIVVALIASATTIAVQLLSAPSASKEIHYRLSPEDQIELNRVRKQYNELIKQYKEQQLGEAVYKKLVVLANEEAKIMQQYDPDFRPRFPSIITGAYSLYYLIILFIALITFGAYLVSRKACPYLLYKRYDIVN